MTAPQTPRWYSVNKIGMATLCADQADAEEVARDCDMGWPRQGPHRAVQLVEDSGMRSMELGSIWSQARAVHPDNTARQNESFMAALSLFAELVTAKERTTRIEAHQRLADMQELAAKSGLAHRKAVQEAVREAVSAEREACAEIAADSDHIVGVPGYYAKLGDARATARNIEKAIRARGTP